MRGRIEIGTSGLSPDGEHFLYSAHKYVNAVLNGLAPKLRPAEVEADKLTGKAR